jgi:hypothetical protein
MVWGELEIRWRDMWKLLQTSMLWFWSSLRRLGVGPVSAVLYNLGNFLMYSLDTLLLELRWLLSSSLVGLRACSIDSFFATVYST